MSEERNKRKPGCETPFDTIEPVPKYPKHSSSLPREPQLGGDGFDKDLLEQFTANWPDYESLSEDLYLLDLSKWQRCKVLTVEQRPNQSLLVMLEGKRDKEKAICCISSPWNTLEHIVPGLTVSVQAVEDKENTGHYTVNSKDGFFVTNPDHLITGTTVVGSLFCRRRGVLQEVYRMVETENQQMHVGSLAHAIFQQCLVDDNCRSLEDVRKLSENLITSKRMVSTLFEYKLDSAEAMQILDIYIKEIAIFLERNIHNRVLSKSNTVEHGMRSKAEIITIQKVNDIEENIWCHQLGIKGRIDATVSVTSENHGSNLGSENQILEVMPLELKTGRASYSFEHVGQLALYEMMLNLVGQTANSGLLVYLREGKMSKIAGNRNTRRDLIMLRNEIAHYVDRWMIRNECNATSTENALLMVPNLPEPINNQRACIKCPYNTVCIVMAKNELKPTLNNLDKTHGLSVITSEVSGHLTNEHIDYFILWSGLLYLEREESLHEYSTRQIWTKKPDERVLRGCCIAKLRLLIPVRKMDDHYYHSFSTNDTTNRTEALSGRMSPDIDKREPNAVFEVGDYVVCSTNSRIAVASGYIRSLVGQEIIATFERDLSIKYSGETFILDRNDSFQSQAFNLGNLTLLLRNSDEAAQLRRIIIGRETPLFTNRSLTKPMIEIAKRLFENLNRHQKCATLKAAVTDSYCLLKGLPGTGKTQTVVALIRFLFALGKSVLLTSNTHSAVDNILKRLSRHEEVKFIRLGSVDRIDPAIRAFSYTELSEECTTPAQLGELCDKFKIVAVTCHGTSHPLLQQRVFDYCIVDEATQVLQPTIIRSLLMSKKFLLVGDPDQLPPVVKSHKARMLGATESLFHRLNQAGSVFILPTQYRMNRVLTKLANDFTYEGKLVCGNDLVANATLKLPKLAEFRQVYAVERWILKTLSNQMDLSAVLVDTGNSYRLNSKYRHYNAQTPEEKNNSEAKKNYSNISEVALIVYMCSALLSAGVEGSSIGVMAPFRSQVGLIRQYMCKLMQKQNLAHHPSSVSAQAENSSHVPHGCCGVEVNTVDQFQGKDKRLIIYSCTRTLDTETAGQPEIPNENTHGVLHDKRRLTVAITRAKEKLIVIGDFASLDSYLPFRDLLNVTNSCARIQIDNKEYGFEWENVFDALNLSTD